MSLNLAKEKILLTGGDGFVGRHVQAELARLGVPKESIVVPLHRDFDLTQEAVVQRLYQQIAPTLVIHLAARVGGIGANRANPGLFLYANMKMGLNLIECGRQAGLKKFVQMGTICAYPKFTPVPFREEDLWNGYPEETNAPYGLAKKSLLVMLQAYRQQYGFNGIFLLPVNLYGPGDNFDPESSHVIPALIRRFMEAKRGKLPKVVVWGTGRASREFLYVSDCARAVVLAARDYDKAEPVNVGAGFEITIKELASKIKALTEYQGELEWDGSKPDGQPRRCLDTSRAMSRFGFKAEVGFEEGLRRTIEWYRVSMLTGDPRLTSS